MFEKWLDRYSSWILVAIFFVGLGMRVWKLPERFLFAGEATQEMYATQWLVTGERSRLLGYPVATYIENLYTPPWYLYLLAVPYQLFSGDPIAFAWLHAIVGAGGIVILYLAGKNWHSPQAGMAAAWLYATWILVINIDRSVWNVGMVPFISCLIMWGLSRVNKSHKTTDFLGLGLILGLALSIHYQFLVATAGVLIYLGWRYQKSALITLLPIILAIVPLIIYDMGHSYIVANAFVKVLKSLIDGSRPHSTNYFLWQFYAPLILLIGIGLSKINIRLRLVLIALFVASQMRSIASYRVSPNYPERVELMQAMLDYWTPASGLRIYFNDRSSYEYGYLMRYLAAKRGIDYLTIVTMEPKTPEMLKKYAPIQRTKAIPMAQADPRDLEDLSTRSDVLLMIDEDQLKIMHVNISPKKK